MVDPYWNHNSHYFPWVLAAAPQPCGLAVDVGCGDGLLVSMVGRVAEQVVGLDASAEMATVAAHNLSDLPSARIQHADFLTWPVPAGSVDFVTAVASLHHMDLAAALTKIDRMLRPGGVFAVVGLARAGSPWDLLCGAACLLPVKILDVRYGGGAGGPDAPLGDADLSWSQTRRTFHDVLPGVVFRRRLAWRYSAYWRKPGGLD